MAHLINDQPKDSNTKSISKTLAILSTFNETTPLQRTSDIAAKLDMSISTVSRNLNILLDWGFLERDDASGYYFPGMKIVTLAGVGLQHNEIYRHAYPELQFLSNRFDLHSHMGVRRASDIVHLICCYSENAMDLVFPMGHCHPMYCSAMGRAMLAYMPEKVTQEVLKNSEFRKYTPDTRITIPEIQQELKDTRKKGYCLLLNELTEGKASLSVPIFDRRRMVVAAISLSGNIHKFRDPESQQELAKAVVTTANKISGKLGYYPK